MTEQEILISVIIPAYNAGRYLKETIDSVNSQNVNAGIEIILADDGSTDDTASVAGSLGCRVLSLPHRCAAAARNAALTASSGNCIFMLDADDIITPGAFKLLLDPFMNVPEAEAVFGKTVDFISPDLTEEQTSVLKPRTSPYTGRLTGCSLIKKDVFDRIGLFDESLKSGETVEWMMRFRNAGIRFLQTDALILNRRLHMTNTGRTHRQGELKNYAALLRKRMKKQ